MAEVGVGVGVEVVVIVVVDIVDDELQCVARAHCAAPMGGGDDDGSRATFSNRCDQAGLETMSTGRYL